MRMPKRLGRGSLSAEISFESFIYLAYLLFLTFILNEKLQFISVTYLWSHGVDEKVPCCPPSPINSRLGQAYLLGSGVGLQLRLGVKGRYRTALALEVLSALSPQLAQGSRCSRGQARGPGQEAASSAARPPFLNTPATAEEGAAAAGHTPRRHC